VPTYFTSGSVACAACAMNDPHLVHLFRMPLSWLRLLKLLATEHLMLAACQAASLLMTWVWGRPCRASPSCGPSYSRDHQPLGAALLPERLSSYVPRALSATGTASAASGSKAAAGGLGSAGQQHLMTGWGFGIGVNMLWFRVALEDQCVFVWPSMS
jgi:hypothetical protein